MTGKNTSNLYQSSGVNIAKGDSLVSWLQERPEEAGKNGRVVSGIGGFAALFQPDFSAYREPLLVSSTDGVGTKLLLAMEQDCLEGLGHDLVAMCVNDIYTIGARPLFFLDYFATGVLSEDQFKRVLSSIRAALKQADCPLLGGETAELPGLYANGHFDLAGFVVGVVDNVFKPSPELVQPGDKLLAFGSNGFHSNGYSLIRHWLKEKPLADSKMMNHLLAPTKIYHEIPKLFGECGPQAIHGIAHITGGGISGNLPRVMPPNTRAVVDWNKVPTPAWMRSFITENGATRQSVEEVFNLGCGMIALVSPTEAERVRGAAQALGLTPVEIGEVFKHEGPADVMFTGGES